MERLLEEGIYQEIRSAVANCSPEWPDFLAIESISRTLRHRVPGNKGVVGVKGFGHPRRDPEKKARDDIARGSGNGESA